MEVLGGDVATGEKLGLEYLCPPFVVAVLEGFKVKKIVSKVKKEVKKSLPGLETRLNASRAL